MKRPLLIVALLYGGGVLLGDRLVDRVSPFAWLAAGIGAGLLCLALTKARPILLGAMLVLCGAANLGTRTAVLAPDDLRVLFKEDAAIVTVRGRLTETPYHRVYDHEGVSSARTLAEVRVEEVRPQRGGWRRASGLIVVSTPGVLPDEFFGGRMIEIEGVLRKPQGPVVQGQFDYRTYLYRHGIYFQIGAQSTNDWRLAGMNQPARPPLTDRFSAWAMRVLALGLPVDESTQLLWTMTLGWKTALTGEVAEPFMRSGTMHIFAISGLHIALIAGILVMVMRAAKVPRLFAGWIVIPLIWMYTGVTGWQASAIRSTVMMSVILFGWMLKRPSDLLNSLAAAALIILVWDPQQLFQASFQLSFCVVLSLALFTPAIDGVRQRVLAEDPFLPAELRPHWQRWLRRLAFWVSSGLVTSLAAWLGSIPLVALYFNLFTPASLLANLVVVPLSSVALAANMGSLAVGAFAPWMAELFNHTAWAAMWLMVWISKTTGHWGWGCWHVGTPSWLGLALYYAVLFAVMGKWWKFPRARYAAAAGIALLCAAWATGKWRARGETRLTAIPLSGGEAICVDAPGRKNDLLIDCGNRSAAEFVVKPFLRSQGIDSFPSLLLTHGDVKNVGGAEFLLHQFPADTVLMSPVVFRSSAYRELKAVFAGKTNLLHSAALGTNLGPWRVLHPDAAEHFSQADDNALVLRGEIHGVRLLLCSDLGKRGQNALLERHQDLRADVVISGVPTQSEPLAGALLEVVQPAVIIVTDALYPATARAGRRLRDRLGEQTARVFYTSDGGAVTVVMRESGWWIENATGEVLFRGVPNSRSAH
jgi:ComEC/Rec2-related protein